MGWFNPLKLLVMSRMRVLIQIPISRNTIIYQNYSEIIHPPQIQIFQIISNYTFLSH